MSWIRGRHSFKIGGGIRYDMYDQVGNQFARGNFQFQNIATGYAFADYMLGYAQQTEAAVALAVTKFRALSQTLLLHRHLEGPLEHDVRSRPALRIHPAVARQERHADERVDPVPRHDAERAELWPATRRWCASAAATSTRTRVLRFAPNIQVARDGRLGDRLIFDDKKNFAPRVGWAYNPTDKWSFRAGTGIFYMQDTGNPRFDMARNLSGRRRDNTLLLTPDLTFDAPFRGGTGTAERLRRGAAAGVPVERLRARQHAGPQDAVMFQYLFNVQRELGGSTALEVGYLGSQSHRLERMFDWNETIPGITGSVQSRKPYPEFTKVQEVGNVAEAKYNSLAVKLTRRLHDGLSVLGGYTLSKSTDNGSGIRTLNGDTLFPQNSFCLDCEWGLSVFDVRHRFVGVDPLRAAVRQRQAVHGGRASARRSSAAGRSARSSTCRAGSREPRYVGTDRSNTGGGQDRPNVVAGQDPNAAGRPAIDPAVVQHRCVRAEQPRHLWATPAATRSSARASPTWTRRSSATSGCSRNKIAAVPARGVQRAEQSDLERPEHDADQPALRHDQRARESRCASCSSA